MPDPSTWQQPATALGTVRRPPGRRTKAQSWAKIALLWLMAAVAVGCQAEKAAPRTPDATPRATREAGGSTNEARRTVVAVESFLADMTSQVAGQRLEVQPLVPLGVDPHGYQPTPADVRLIAESDAVIINGAGLESFLGDLLETAGRGRPTIVASQGLEARRRSPSGEEDPHFWLDPVLAKTYVANIRDGLAALDPAGAETYAANAAAYTAELEALDHEIRSLLAPIPAERRRLVTNHESLGYFADRYALEIVGTVLPGPSSLASASGREVAALVEAIRASGAPAIFVEVTANAELAEQVAKEANVRLITDLYTHSLSAADGPAPTYLAMMRHNARRIAAALLEEGERK